MQSTAAKSPEPLLVELKRSLKSTNYRISSPDNGIDNDFLLGNISNGVYLDTLQDYCKRLGSEKFESHVSRLLKKSNNNHLIVSAGDSSASGFPAIVKALRSDIAFVELYSSGEPYMDLNLLHIRLYLSDGVLDFRPSWTAWKELRARELVRSVSVLLECQLIEKTYILVDESGRGYSKKLFVPTDPKEFILEICDLINERWIGQSDIDELCEPLLKNDKESV